MGVYYLTRVARAEIHSKDVVTEAREIIQLSEVTLQRTAGEAGFVERSHKTKHKGIQTGWPAVSHKKTTFRNTLKQ